jgi:hypothetical protein
MPDGAFIFANEACGTGTFFGFTCELYIQFYSAEEHQKMINRAKTRMSENPYK